ncbi:MAG: hypothetical protein IH846_14315 [Acidobacteria bacterium]|nr:hypothetical protein [Acidobacteriota bacterium]
MNSKQIVVIVVLVGLLMVSSPMFAHHSMAMYDRSREVTFQGTVTKFRFINPHTQILFDVEDGNGNVDQWISFSPSPNRMRREAGWNRKTIKPGDRIAISGYIARDGRKIMSTLKIILNGKELNIG